MEDKHRRPVLMVALLAAVASMLPAIVAGQVAAIGTPAPEITGGPWINSEPLSIATLRGRVVLIDFWTYG